MWASVTFIRTRKMNPRTEIHLNQQRQFTEFAWNGTRELIIPCSIRMSKEMWASGPFIRTRLMNPRTEIQLNQQRQITEFAWNGTRELIIPCTNRMARKCEQALYSYKNDNPIHAPRSRLFNEVSAPSSLGMEPERWLGPFPVQIEWPENVSKRNIYAKKTKQSTYRDFYLIE
jgi:hypothetical protein